MNNFYTYKRYNHILNTQKDLYHFGSIGANTNLTRMKSGGTGFATNVYNCEILKKYSLRFPCGYKSNEDGTFLFLYRSLCQNIEISNDLIFIYRGNPDSFTSSKKDIFDLFLNNVIPAWKWAENKSIEFSKKYADIFDKKSIEYCRRMQRIFILEMILLAVREGKNYSTCKNAIQNSGLWDHFNDKNITLSKTNQLIYMSFTQRSYLFIIKQRFDFITRKMLKKFLISKLRNYILFPQKIPSNIYSKNKQ